MEDSVRPVWRGKELYGKLPSPRFRTMDPGGLIVPYNKASFLIDMDEALRRCGVVNSFHYLYLFNSGNYRYMRLEKPLTARQLMPVDRRRLDRAVRSLPLPSKPE